MYKKATMTAILDFQSVLFEVFLFKSHTNTS